MKFLICALLAVGGLVGEAAASCPCDPGPNGPRIVARSDRGGLFARRPVRRFFGRLFGRRCG